MFYYLRITYFFQVLLGFDIYKRNWINLRDKNLLTLIIIYPFWYLLQLICAALNLLLIGELIFLLVLVTHKNCRKLNKQELEILTKQFPGFNWKKLRLIENSWLANIGKRYSRATNMGVCVSYSVHFSCELNIENHRIWLIHESTHYLQYHQRGIIYIFEALIAQRFSGYNYKLSDWEKYQLKAFNPEQQAEILSKENWTKEIVL